MIHLRITQKPFNSGSFNIKKSESIYLSSTSLYDSLQTHKNKSSQLLTLYRYKSRITTRPTPFGLLAGIGQVKISVKTKVILPQSSLYQKVLRLDMNYVGALIKHLELLSEIQKQINWFPNNTLYKKHRKLRYIEHYFIKANKFHKLSAVDFSFYLAKLMQTAQKGASLNNIAQSIICEEISFEESYDFVLELINNQLLVSDLELTVTTKNNLQDLIDSLSSLKGGKMTDTFVTGVTEKATRSSDGKKGDVEGCGWYNPNNRIEKGMAYQQQSVGAL